MTGDITAPRVVLEDGARFRGLVDMGESARGATPATSASGGVGRGKAGRADTEASSTSAEPPAASRDANGTPSTTTATPAKGKDAASTVEGAAS